MMNHRLMKGVNFNKRVKRIKGTRKKESKRMNREKEELRKREEARKKGGEKVRVNKARVYVVNLLLNHLINSSLFFLSLLRASFSLSF